MLTKQAKCNVFGVYKIYKTTPGNLKSHLKNRHIEIYRIVINHQTTSLHSSEQNAPIEVNSQCSSSSEAEVIATISRAAIMDSWLTVAKKSSSCEYLMFRRDLNQQNRLLVQYLLLCQEKTQTSSRRTISRANDFRQGERDSAFFFKKSSAATEKLLKFQKTENEGAVPLKLKQDMPTRWNSTFNMILWFIELQSAIKSTVAVIGKDLPIISNEEWILL